MELNALTRWQSIGKSLYLQGKLHKVIHKLHKNQSRKDLSIKFTHPNKENYPTDPSDQKDDENYNSNHQVIVRKDGEKSNPLYDDSIPTPTPPQLSPPLPTSLHSIPSSHIISSLVLYYSLRRFSKGFLIGYIGRLTFALFGSLLKSKGNFKFLIELIRKSLFERETLAYGGFLGTFLAVFEQIWRGTQCHQGEGQREKNIVTDVPEDIAEEDNNINKIRGDNNTNQIVPSSSPSRSQSDPIDGDSEVSTIDSDSIEDLSESDIEVSVETVKENQRRGKGEESTKKINIPFPPSLPTLSLSSLYSSIPSPSLTPFAFLNLSRESRIISGAFISSIVALKFIPKNSRMGISVFFLCRAIEIVGKLGVEWGWLPHIPHSDTLLMSLASAQVIWAWLFCRSVLENSYIRFLDYQGGRSNEVRTAYAGLSQFGIQWLASESNKSLMDKLNVMREKKGYSLIDLSKLMESIRQNPSSRLPIQCSLACNIAHPQTPYCTIEFLTFLRAAFSRALPVYAPVFIIPVLLFRPSTILSRPLPILYKTLVGIFRSSLFLSLYCSTAWLTTCWMTHYLHISSSMNGVMAGTIGGSMVIMEKKDRRIELALYVLAQAIPSMGRTLILKGWAKPIPHIEFLLFGLSMSIIMYSYICRPEVLRPSYWSLLRFFFGSGGRSAHFHTKQQISEFEIQEKKRSKEREMAMGKEGEKEKE